MSTEESLWVDFFKMGLNMTTLPNPPTVYGPDSEDVSPKWDPFEYATNFAEAALECYRTSANLNARAGSRPRGGSASPLC